VEASHTIRRGLVSLLLVAAFALALPNSLADNGDKDNNGNGSDETGCVNLEYDHWGGPLFVRPYAEEIIGVIVTEDVGDGLTAALLIVPDACGPQSGDHPLDSLTATAASIPHQSAGSGVPVLP
jgi:hypothetical protein